MVTDLNQMTCTRHGDASFATSPQRGARPGSGRQTGRFCEVCTVAPLRVDTTGQDRLRINTGITGGPAHAAVRMHAFPVFGSFWAYCQKPMTRHSQRPRVAT